MSLNALPALNAILNATAAVLLIRAYILIREGRREEHRRVMLLAFGVSIAFLISYLVFHALAGTVYFQGSGAVRWAYLAILTSHTILAATVPVLAIITLRRGLKGKFTRHRTIARWTLPIWLYVSVTGVIVYVMLYWL
jgi:putative membrane protein